MKEALICRTKKVGFKTNKKLTIGLCVKNSANVVKTAFDCISIQDYPHELLKLVIVDNGSTDKTLSLAKKFAKETDINTFVILNKGKGLGASRQIAVNNAEGDYILFEDDDLVLSKDFVRNQLAFMENNPNVGAAEGIYLQVQQKNSLGRFVGARYIRDSRYPKTIGTGGAIFRLKALESVGGFDSRMGAQEDVDISRRLTKAGWLLAANNSAGLYAKHPLTSLTALWRKNRWYGYGNHYQFHKYNDHSLIMIYFPPLVLWGAIKISYLTYRVTKRKGDFVFSIFYSLSLLAHHIGFIQAHLDGHGHSIATKD